MLTKTSISIAMVLFSLAGSFASAGTVGIADVHDKSFRVRYKRAHETLAQREARLKDEAIQAEQVERPVEMLALRAPIEIDNPVSAAPDTTNFEKVTMPRLPASQPRKKHRKHSKKAHHAKHHQSATTAS